MNNIKFNDSKADMFAYSISMVFPIYSRKRRNKIAILKYRTLLMSFDTIRSSRVVSVISRD